MGAFYHGNFHFSILVEFHILTNVNSTSLSKREQYILFLTFPNQREVLKPKTVVDRSNFVKNTMLDKNLKL